MSGPQVVEGWYGMPFAKPLARTREYIGILRDIWARKGPVTNDGEHYPLPLPDGTGLGKPLKASIHPLREDIPIFLGAEGPKNIALCAELCDGWLAMLFSPANEEMFKESLEEGFARPGARRGAGTTSRWPPPCRSSSPTTCAGAIDALRPFYALYFGGMGAKGRNFHANVAIRMGHGEMIERVQELYLGGKKDEAAAAIPASLIEELSLVGPPDKIRARPRQAGASRSSPRCWWREMPPRSVPPLSWFLANRPKS